MLKIGQYGEVLGQGGKWFDVSTPDGIDFSLKLRPIKPFTAVIYGDKAAKGGITENELLTTLCDRMRECISGWKGISPDGLNEIPWSRERMDAAFLAELGALKINDPDKAGETIQVQWYIIRVVSNPSAFREVAASTAF